VRAYLGPGPCLPTSATNTTYGHQPELSFPRRDGGHDPLPFLTRHARPSLARSGDTRRAAQRPFVRAPVPVPPACAGLPDRDTPPTAPPRATCVARVQWRLTRTGLWTERRTCPRAWRALLGRLREECVRLAHADDVPLLGIQRAPVVAGAAACTGRAPQRQDGPAKTHVSKEAREGCQRPVNQGAFHRCDDGHAKGSLLALSRVGLSLTPPTRSPHGWGQVLWMGIASVARGFETGGDVVLRLRESRTPL